MAGGRPQGSDRDAQRAGDVSVLRRLLGLAGASRARVALSVALGALTVCFAAGLMGTSGYLVSRAAEHPAILSLGVAIAAVRFFGIGRPLVRYLERLASHDLALRTLARLRVRFYERIEPLAPAGLVAFRRGDLLSRLVSDVDTLQNLFLRGVGPPLVALGSGAVLVGVTAVILPVAGLALGVGLILGGAAAPVLVAGLGRPSRGDQAAARGELSAELVELLRSAPELAAYGHEEDALGRVRAADRELARHARRNALVAGVGEASATVVAGLTAVAVLALAVTAHADGRLSRVLVAALALIALAAFEATGPLLQAGQELATTIAAGRRLLELTDRDPPVRDPDHPLPPPEGTPTVAFDGVHVSYAPRSTASASASSRAARSPSPAPAGPARRPSPTCCSGFSTPKEDA